MSKRLARRKSDQSPQPSSGLSPAALTLLIAFGAIGGLNGIAAIISAVGTLIEAESKRCNGADSP
jgi:hypothetical protein